MKFEISRNAAATIDRLIAESEASGYPHMPRSDRASGAEGAVYLRLARRCLPQAPDKLSPVLDLASIDVEHYMRRQGIFNDVLAVFEEKAAASGRGVFVENVASRHLMNCLPRKGYELVMAGESPCFLKPHAVLVAELEAQQLASAPRRKPGGP